ncbi:MAG: polyprenyl synthetase family protein, partial [Nocardioides sp.]|nr:polyprenyl synthetase family protein [Nocardioides sp.]
MSTHHRAPQTHDTLAAVEQLLGARLVALADEWHAHDAATATGDAVLGGLDLPELLASLVLSGGKRFRPVMCHWGWVAAGGSARGADPSTMVQVAAALELLHAVGLAQDDVMDRSEVRRGRPTMHVLAAGQHRDAGGTDDADRFGESIAVLVGDLGHAEADALVAGMPAAVRRL